MDNEIRKLLRSMFTEDAILAGALCEQLDDIRYCTEHHMMPLSEKWNAQADRIDRLTKNDKTFNVKNMKKFQTKVNEYRKNNPGVDIEKGLTETELGAFYRFYHFNCY